MRRFALAAFVLILPAAADACPLFKRYRPRPVVYHAPPCPTPAVPVQPPPKVAEEPPKWATVRGRVVFEGDPIPKQTPIRGANGAYTEDWVVDPVNRGVKNVIVWLAPEPTAEQLEALKTRRLREFPGFKAENIHPSLAGPIDRRIYLPADPRAFVPRVTAMRAGSNLTFDNLTGIVENLRFESDKNGEINKAVAPLVPYSRVMFAERMPILVSSAVSPWMRAYVKIFDHPYFTVTNADGTFEIPNAPVGDLRIFYWQEDSGYRNGAAGRLGEPIKIEKAMADVGEVKIKALKLD